MNTTFFSQLSSNLVHSFVGIALTGIVIETANLVYSKTHGQKYVPFIRIHA